MTIYKIPQHKSTTNIIHHDLENVCGVK